MPLFRRIRGRRNVARLLLACLLFTQAALAAVPCLSPAASVGDAFAAAAPPVCHKAPPANLCLAQCMAADQSSGPFQAALAPPPAPTLEVAPIVLVSTPAVRRPDPHMGVRALGPPPFLRLCSLLL